MSEPTAVARALSRLHRGVVIPNYEALLAQDYQRFLDPDAVVVDVGAHDGLHLEQLAAIVRPPGRVIAFEPMPNYAAFLAERFRDRPYVAVRAVALGREPGRSRFFHLHGEPSLSGLQLRADATAAPTMIDVEVDTLDRQAADLARLDYIKIDIEGGEIDCLLGGRQAIMRHRPIISVEYGSPGYSLYGHAAMTLFDLARELHYVLSDLFGNFIETAPDWMAVCDLSYWDYFLVPRERRADWRRYFPD